MGVVDLLRLPLVVGRVGEHRDGAIAGPADQDEAKVMRSPLNRVDTAIMVSVLVDLGPLAPTLLPDDHTPVVRTGGEDVAKP